MTPVIVICRNCRVRLIVRIGAPGPDPIKVTCACGESIELLEAE